MINLGKVQNLIVIQSNPLDVGREMSADIDVRHFNSRKCRPLTPARVSRPQRSNPLSQSIRFIGLTSRQLIGLAAKTAKSVAKALEQSLKP